MWVTPYFEAVAKLNFAVDGPLWINCGVNASGLLKTGVGWKRGRGTYGILKAEMDIDRHGPTWGSDINAVITPSLGFRPKLLFYDIV